MEDQEEGLVLSGLDLLLGVGLVLGEKLGVELNVAGLVYTVDIAEGSSDGEVLCNGREGLVDLVDVLGLGVEGVVVDASVVNTIFLTTSDTDLLWIR